MHASCSAHILNLNIRDKFVEIRNLLNDICQTVICSEIAPSSLQKSKRAKQQCKLQDRKTLASDVPTRYKLNLWERHLSDLDRLICVIANFLNSTQECDITIVVVECLRIFYETTHLFSGSKYPTSNVFFQLYVISSKVG